MALNLASVKYVDDIDKILISGYIREMFTVVPPELIEHIIVLFYYEYDRLHEKEHGHLLTIIDEMTVTNKSNRDHYQNALLTKTVESGIFCWKFRLDAIGRRGRDRWDCLIGIWNTKSKNPTAVQGSFTTNDCEGYAFVTLAGKLTNPKSPGNYWKEYGKKCDVGQEIEMILDMDKLELSYKIDDVPYGVAFPHLKNSSYRAAIYFYDKGSSITLLSSRRIG